MSLFPRIELRTIAGLSASSNKPTLLGAAPLVMFALLACSNLGAPPTLWPLPVPGARQITSDLAYYRDLIWAPDARLIAATRCPVVSAEPRCQHQEETVLLQPETAGLEVVDLRTNMPDTIASRPVAWSPGSDKLLLYVEERVAGEGAAGSQYSYLEYEVATREFEVLGLVGTAIAWDDTGERLLMIRPADAGIELGWTAIETGDFAIELVYTGQESLLGPYALSPDGGTLLRGDNVQASLCNEVGSYQMGSHGAFEPYLSLACFPSWSPDGSEVVYAEKNDPKSLPSRLVVIEADGSNPRPVLGEEKYSGLSFPAWSPDGRWIAFTRTGLGNASAVYIAEAPAGTPP